MFTVAFLYHVVYVIKSGTLMVRAIDSLLRFPRIKESNQYITCNKTTNMRRISNTRFSSTQHANTTDDLKNNP